MKIYMNISHPYVTEEFYGEPIPDFVSEFFECSDPVSRKLLYSGELMRCKHHMTGVRVKMSGSMYQWCIRRQENLKSGRDYAVGTGAGAAIGAGIGALVGEAGDVRLGM